MRCADQKHKVHKVLLLLQSYRDAVAKNVDTIKGKTVLDLGCGTSILSMFCARHGQAKQVVGVDMSSIAHQAMDIVIENKLEDTVKIVKVSAFAIEKDNRSAIVSGGSKSSRLIQACSRLSKHPINVLNQPFS